MEGVKYLIVKMLAGKRYAVNAIYSYLVEGKSPSFLAKKYNVSKGAIKNYIVQYVSKAGGEEKAKKLIVLIRKSNAKIKPIIAKYDELYICLLCNRAVSERRLELHIENKHKAEVQKYLEYLLEKMRR